MALLYLLDDCMAVDEDGSQWVRDDEGAWQRRVEQRPPRLRLVTGDDRPGATASAPARTRLSRPSWASIDALQVAR